MKKDRLCIICAAIGSPNPVIKAGTAQELLNERVDEIPQCLIVPGKLHFVEEEALALWKS